MSKDVGDLNLRLKMELGALKEENLNVVRKNEQIKREMQALEAKLLVWKICVYFFWRQFFPVKFQMIFILSSFIYILSNMFIFLP